MHDVEARASTREMFARVIAFPTVKGQSNVPEMAAYLADAIRQAGWVDSDVTVVPHETCPLDGSAIDNTAALIVRWHGQRPSGPRRPFLMMGHTCAITS